MAEIPGSEQERKRGEAGTFGCAFAERQRTKLHVGVGGRKKKKEEVAYVFIIIRARAPRRAGFEFFIRRGR